MPTDYVHTALQRYIDWAIKTQEELYLSKNRIKNGTADSQAVYAARTSSDDMTSRRDVLKGWLNVYKVFQGIKEPSREDILGGLFDFYDSDQPSPKGRIFSSRVSESLALFSALSRSLEGTSTRSLLSLKSKALWCRYPKSIPIYDRYVFSAITYLSKLGNEHPAELKIYRRPQGMSKYDLDMVEYEIFIRNYFPMYLASKKYIVEQLAARRSQYPYPIRVFDKAMWAFGSFSHDVPYRLAAYKTWSTL